MRNKEGLVDDLITSIPGEWKFDEQVSQHFDTHVRKSVPLYEEVQKAVIEISEWFIRDNSVVYDLGSSTGETISLLLQKHKRKKNVKSFRTYTFFFLTDIISSFLDSFKDI